jgi:predicted DNA-binding mobile mystery protein A
MSRAQLGRRLGLTRQSIEDLEHREVDEGVSLAALASAARAMDAELVYAIVPRRSLEETLRARAHTVAESELRRVAHSMRLEAQDVSREEYAQQLAERKEELLRTWSRRLWDEEKKDLPRPGD